MANFLRQLPDLDYPSLLKDRQSSGDTVRVKNIFRRVKVREDYFSNFVEFVRYSITGDERPDNVAEKIYGNPDLDWIVLISNNIIDIKNEWPMSEYDLNIYLNEKYTPQQLAEIKYYRTIEWRDRNNQLIVPAGQIVDENFEVEYLKGNQITSVSPIRSVSVFEWELEQNDAKRNINLIDPQYVGTVIEEYEQIMKYGKSSQYVNERLKKTENIRISG
jgi:hypothetical protein